MTAATSAKQHYDQRLGEHYAWSVAAGGDPFDRAATWLARHDLLGHARYLDLGAGFGAHSVPLARAGKLRSQISSSPKLRIAPAAVAAWAASSGLVLDHPSSEQGMLVQRFRPA
jgi:hypothetical protein